MRFFNGLRAATALRGAVAVCAAGFGMVQAAAPASALYVAGGSLTGLITYSNLNVPPGCPYGSFHAGGIGAGAGVATSPTGAVAGEPFGDLDATAQQCSLGAVSGSISVTLQNTGVGSVFCNGIPGGYSTIGAVLTVSASGSCTVDGSPQFVTFTLVGVLEGPAYSGVFAIS